MDFLLKLDTVNKGQVTFVSEEVIETPIRGYNQTKTVPAAKLTIPFNDWVIANRPTEMLITTRVTA